MKKIINKIADNLSNSKDIINSEEALINITDLLKKANEMYDKKNIYQLLIASIKEIANAENVFLLLNTENGFDVITFLQSEYTNIKQKINITEYQNTLSELRKSKQKILEKTLNSKFTTIIPLILLNECNDYIFIEKSKEEKINSKQLIVINLIIEIIRFAIISTKNNIDGIYNLESFLEFAEAEFYQAKRYKNKLSMLNIEITNFDEITNLFKKEVVQKIYKNIIQILKFTIREVDIIGRHQENSLLLLLPETDAKGANIVSDTIKFAISKMEIQELINNDIRLNSEIKMLEYNDEIEKFEEFYDILTK